MAKKKRKSPTAAQRRKYGMKGKAKGKFPVYSQRTAMSALKLRGRGKGVSRSSVIAKVSRWANSHNNATVKAAVKRARAADRKRKKKR